MEPTPPTSPSPPEEKIFRTHFQVTWGDLDANVHLRNTAYLDYAAQTRFLYLASQGFTPAEFRSAGLGPVVLKDEVEYRKELRHLDAFYVDFRVAAQSPDGSRFTLVNRFFRADGTLCAEVRSHGGWFDVKQRKIVRPPDGLLKAMDAVARTSDFRVLG